MSLFVLIYSSERNFDTELNINIDQYKPNERRKILFCDLCRKIIYNNRKFLMHYKLCQIKYTDDLNKNQKIKKEVDDANDGDDDEVVEDDDDDDDDANGLDDDDDQDNEPNDCGHS